MRRIVLTLLALVLLVPGLGCMAVSSHVRGVCRKSVVVYEGELYVVDLNECIAHKVMVREDEPSDGAEVIVIETEG